VPVIVNIAPKTIPAATLTTIVVLASSPDNLSLNSFEWDFGDGQTATTSVNSVAHAYAATGTYKLSIRVTDSKGQSAKKEFNLIVGSPRDMIATLISQKTRTIDSFVNNLSIYSDWEKQAIKEALSIDGLKQELSAIQGNFSFASTEEQYIDLMVSLNGLSVPVSTSIYSTAAEFTYPVDPDKVDLTNGWFCRSRHLK